MCFFQVVQCRYNIVRDEGTQHLCADSCFSKFKESPSKYLITKTKDNSCFNCHKNLLVGNGKIFSLNVTSNLKAFFCSPRCTTVYMNMLKMKCAYCQLFVGKDSKEAILNQTKDKIFCNKQCREFFKQTPTSKNCAQCRIKFIPGKKYSATKEEFFCKGCETSSVKSRLKSYCYHCIKMSDNADMILLDTSMRKIKLCKNKCVTDCIKGLPETLNKKCDWCKKLRGIYGMVDVVEDFKVKLFCDLKCESLYRVNKQASLTDNVSCDQCKEKKQAQYHLTMSDASVRNFCSFKCVTAFQTQYSGKSPLPQVKTDGSPPNLQQKGMYSLFYSIIVRVRAYFVG